jgi:GT2 family glycosyltransferase
LGPCLQSLYRQEFDDFETILVDNGSHDGSVTFVRDSFPQVKIICFDENRGFASAVNAGILAAQGRYIGLLNNDTEVDASWLKELVAALDVNPQAGSVAAKILFHSDPDSVNSAGDEFSFFGVAYQRRFMRGDAALFSEPKYVFSACGAAALYRRELFEKVGLFDEHFFAYQEDVDLGFRAQLAGYRCIYAPNAVVYHKHHGTLSKASDMWLYLRERNKQFVIIKNLPVKLLLVCFPFIALHQGFSLAEAAYKGYLLTYLRAWKDALQALSRMLESRRRIQTERAVTEAYVLGLIRFWEPLRILAAQLGSKARSHFDSSHKLSNPAERSRVS